MKNHEKREILEETEWMVVYRLENGQSLHESKFLTKDATVTADALRERWGSFSPKQRYDFVRAYQAKPEVTSEDEKVLEFLMDSEDPAIWATIAPLLARHKKRERILAFILSRIQQPWGPKANFYQVLGALSAPESVPILKQSLLKHREEMLAHPSLQSWNDRLIYLDYLSCSAALFAITHERQFIKNLKEMLQHSDHAVQEMVGAVARSSGITIT